MRIHAILLTTWILGGVFVARTQAATVVNPILVNGPGDAIDPPGAETVDVSAGTAQATLEARSDLRVLQSFDGFAGGGNNVVSFTDTTLPDIQFQFSGAFDTSQAGNDGTNNVFATSAGSQLIQRNADPGSNSSTLTISFGTWNGSTFTNNQTVNAAAFILTNIYGNKSGVVTFRDAGGTALTGATFNYTGVFNTDGTGNHVDLYFGWDSDAQSTAKIGSVSITFVDSGAEFNSGFDDLAFTAIPEPGGAVLCFMAGLSLLRRRR